MGAEPERERELRWRRTKERQMGAGTGEGIGRERERGWLVTCRGTQDENGDGNEDGIKEGGGEANERKKPHKTCRRD